MAAVLLRRTKLAKFNVRSLSFNSFGLQLAIINRLEEAGIVKPTEIQEKAISHVMRGKSAILNAETGSGKTLCYLLPIANALLTDAALVSSPPYALILVPTAELCHQVADMFRTVAGPTLLTSVVHKDERLQLGTRKHVVIATPSSLLSYRSSVFETARVVVVDEADHMITSGGKDMWTILNSLKMRTIVRDASITEKHKKGIGSGFSHSRDTGQGKERQFVFLAATLPARGRKAAFSVLRRWLPDTDLISSSLVHQPVPEVLISYVRVQEEQKLPALLRCLDCLVDDLEINEISLGTEVSSDSSRLHQDDNERNKNVTAAGGRRGTTCEDYGGSQSVLRRGNGDCVSSNGVRRHCRSPGELRVLVFANSAKRAAEAFRLLNGVNGGNGQPSLAASSRDARAHGHTSGGWWKGRCGQIHKDVPPPERLTALEKFRSRLLSVLICTDLAARGLDLPCVSHVIQLDFATNAAQVLHRTGRTARAGSSGTVVNFVTRADEDLVRAVRSTETGPGAPGYQSTFSRNRMFRRRVKAGKVP